MISIYINYHNQSYIFRNSHLIPIHVGKALSNRELDILGDDSGDNISDRNREFCELTGQYYVWKNIKDKEFYGFMHYRRLFDFAQQKTRQIGPHGTIDIPAPYESILVDYGLTESGVEDYLKDCDVVVAKPYDVTGPGIDSVYEQYLLAPFHFIEHLDEAGRIIKEKYPDYFSYYSAAMEGTELYANNMFVMRASIFEHYSSWLFDILFELDRRIDVRDLGVQEKRAIGYVAERLLTVYVRKLLTERAVRVKTADRVFIGSTTMDSAPPTTPLTDLPVVTVAAATDAVYVQHMGALVASTLKTASHSHFIDFIILDGGIGPIDRSRLLTLAKLHPNCRISFVDMSHRFTDLHVYGYFTRGTFFRLALPEIMSDRSKVLYLDTDMVVLRDISALFDTDLGDALVAATPDLVMRAFGNMGVESTHESGGQKAMRYLNDRLGLDSAQEYFQAGVLIFNLDEMRRTQVARKMIHALKYERFWFLDQDVLNKYMHGRVLFLDGRWNALFMDEKHWGALDSRSCKEYQHALGNAWIVHYAGINKPWNGMEHPYASEYWEALRLTVWYEKALLGLLTKNATPPILNQSVHPGSLYRKSVSLWLARRIWRSLPTGARKSLTPLGTKIKKKISYEA